MSRERISNPADFESWWYDSKITIALTPPSSGWVDLILTGTPRGNLCTVAITYLFNDFSMFFDWLRDIAAGKLPAELEVDEEGSTVSFSALPVLNRADWIELRLTRRNSGGKKKSVGETIYHSRVKRRQLVHEFCRRWEQWIREDYIPQEWHLYGCRKGSNEGNPDPRALNWDDLRPFLKKAR